MDRPEVLNAYDAEMYASMSDAWKELETDSSLRVGVLTGAGTKAFCAGNDLGKMAAGRSGGDRRRNTVGSLLRADQISKPVIAAINGFCLAGGLGLALQCDLRVADSTATFGTMAAKRGLLAAGGQSQRLARYVPIGKAFELLYFGERIDAEEALKINLVNRVVDAGMALKGAMEWAEVLARGAPLALAAAKRAIYEGGLSMPLEPALELEASLFGDLAKTDDAREGVKAFVEKRQPILPGGETGAGPAATR
jgi:enoyl-CoA hydratase/carnithine racemase